MEGWQSQVYRAALLKQWFSKEAHGFKSHTFLQFGDVGERLKPLRWKRSAALKWEPRVQIPPSPPDSLSGVR